MTTLMSIASEPVFSFCIKCTRPEVTEEIIHKCLQSIGIIHSIDFVEKHTALPDDYSKHYKMVFIHLKKWSQFYENIAIRGPFIDKLQSGINFTYDNQGHYFTLHENYNPKYKSDNYIYYLEKQLEEEKQKTALNYEKTQQQLQELSNMNQQLMTYNTTLQQQISWLSAQYVPATFSHSSNLNPYAQSYQQTKPKKNKLHSFFGGSPPTPKK